MVCLCKLDGYLIRIDPGIWLLSGIISFSVAMLALLALVACFITTLFVRRNLKFTTSSLVVVILVGSVIWNLPWHTPGYFTVLGVEHRLEKDAGYDELRKFSADAFQRCGKDVLMGNTLPESLKVQLIAQYPFLNWPGKHPMPPSYLLLTDTGNLEVAWGGGLGHWGFVISRDGKPLASETHSYCRILQKEKDVYYFLRD